MSLNSSFSRDPPATEAKLKDTVSSLATRADVEKISQTMLELARNNEIVDLRSQINKIEAELIQRVSTSSLSELYE
jgi:hypothetical protein